MQRASSSIQAQRSQTRKPYIYESVPIICFLNGYQLIRLTVFCKNSQNNQKVSSFIVYINTSQSQNAHLTSIGQKYKKMLHIPKIKDIKIRLFEADKYGKKQSGVIREDMIDKILKYREKAFYFADGVQVKPQQNPIQNNESSQFSSIEFQNLIFKQTIVQIEYVDSGKTQKLQKSQFMFEGKQSILYIKKFFFNKFKTENLAFYFYKNNEDFYTDEQLKKNNHIGMLMNEENVVKILIRVLKKVQRKSKLQNSDQLSFNSESLDNISKSRQSISSRSVDLQSYEENTPDLTGPETLILYSDSDSHKFSFPISIQKKQLYILVINK